MGQLIWQQIMNISHDWIRINKNKNNITFFHIYKQLDKTNDINKLYVHLRNTLEDFLKQY